MKGIFFLTLFFSAIGWANAYDTLRVNLSNTWHTYDDALKVTSVDGNKQVIHFQLPVDGSDYLEIKSKHPISIFLNDKLGLTNQSKIIWPIDSLRKVYFSGLRISIYSEHGPNDMATNAMKIVPDQNKRLVDANLSSIMIAMSVILAAALVILFRTGPQTTLEYFNIVKIFSIRNTDDGVAITRITSANNLFFYIFCSALIAINLFALSIPSLTRINFSSTIYLMDMLYLTGIVLFVLILKIISITFFAWLFRLSEFAPSQFYNFIRLLLVGFSISAIALLVNFTVGGDLSIIRPILIGFILVLLSVFIIITYAKLNSRGGFTVFHLFSYLCVSEIIPFIILLNIYFP